EQRAGGGNHSTFTSREILGGIEAERHSVARSIPIFVGSSDRAAFKARARGMGSIFDDVNIPAPGQFPDRVHLARQSTEMHRYDGACPASNALLDSMRRDVAVGPDIGEYGLSADMEDCVHGSAKRQRARDDLVAGTNIQAGQGQMKRRRSGIDSKRMIRSDV